MKIMLIRHGDPDYIHNTVTERGAREAQLLVPRMMKETVRDFYVSPLGRALDTAAPTLKAMGRTAQVLDWLQEFPANVDVNQNEEWLTRLYPDTNRDESGRYVRRVVWDIMPSQWTEDPDYYTLDGWRNTPLMKYSDMEPIYDHVCASLDGFLEKYGYYRNGMIYRTEHGNTDTIVFFCHFGVACVLLSHLLNIPVFLLWQGLCLAPSSVSEIYTEEREKGVVSFRAARLGDISHLYAGGQEPSFAARFCEAYDSGDRH